MNVIKVSIITVCYNAVCSIERTILSVLNQTYSNVEYLIVDGSSTDGTIKILNKYEDRIKYISEKDRGIFDAMNKGLKMATGDFIIFMGADDVFVNDNVLDKVIEHVVDLNSVYYGNVIYSDTGAIYDGKFNSWKISVKNICHQSLFYPKIVYSNYSYNEKYKLAADWYYNWILYNHKVKFVYVPITISLYNRTGQSSDSQDKSFLCDRATNICKTLGFSRYVYFMIYKLFHKLFKNK